MDTRIRFQEKPCLDGLRITPPLEFEDGGKPWIPVVSCSAQFPLELFETALMTLINHPEYNSSLILRTDIVSDNNVTHDHLETSQWIPFLKGYSVSRNISRRLLPRRPGRDKPLEQDCTFYLSQDAFTSNPCPCILILTPHLKEDNSLPYYHPAVSHLAFRYISTDSNDGAPQNHLVIELVPLDNQPITLTSRLYRTCLALLETVDRYGWGAANNYKKRVFHDVLVPRNEYQDLYLVLKERHKSLVENWRESTDPAKHVYEDVGIATFLMLLWKDTYDPGSISDLPKRDVTCRPWDNWPRPPGGFVDIGCGNGVLTHILLSEGYLGEGFDLRARTSWSHYPLDTQRHLHVHPFNPFERHPQLCPSAFLIGNHADELTPWIPILATLLPASGYLSIPCCPWSFDARYERGGNGAFPIPQFDHKSTEHQTFVEKLGLVGEGQGETSYSKYRIWLGYLSSACGWNVECEMLRIPSTRNWAIVGRKRIYTDAGVKIAQDIVSAVRERGIFKARIPEGKSQPSNQWN